MIRKSFPVFLAWFSMFGFSATRAQNALNPAAPSPAPTPASPSAPAQEPMKVNPPSPTDAVTSATVEQIMDQAVKNISRRYNLNDAQTRETHDLMKREVNRFLKEHESEVWPVLRDLLAAQMNGKPPDSSEERARLGKAARPLLKLARDAIFQANAEWRDYLDPVQKVTHDYDLAEMRVQFEKIDQNFGKLEKGEIPDDGGIFPPPPPIDRSPPRPRKPPEGLPDPEVVETNIFDNFVEVFIRDFKLNEGQADAAKSILIEYKTKAEAFKQANKTELTKLALEEKAARDAHDRERRLKAEKANKDLLAPVYALYAEFENRLKGLLTTAQLQVYEARHSTEATVEERIRSDSTRVSQVPAMPMGAPSKPVVRPPAGKAPGQPTPAAPPQAANGAPPAGAEKAKPDQAPAVKPQSPAPAAPPATTPSPAPKPKPENPPKEEPPPTEGSPEP